MHQWTGETALKPPRALISRIDEQLFSSGDQHLHPDMVKRAVDGPKWHQRPETGYRHLVYDIFSERDGGIRHMTAVYVPTIRAISSRLWEELAVARLSFGEVLKMCNDLLERRTVEYRAIAFDWCFRMKRHYERSHFPIFERWTRTYLTSWGSVDDYCTHTMGFFLHKYPNYVPQIKLWAQSSNPWVRRAAAVTFIYGLRRGSFVRHIFDVADTLLHDEHKYVQWGYGWMLKEASKHFLDEVFRYVMQNKTTMPRRALRYVIEKMPAELKTQAMN